MFEEFCYKPCALPNESKTFDNGSGWKYNVSFGSSCQCNFINPTFGKTAEVVDDMPIQISGDPVATPCTSIR